MLIIFYMLLMLRVGRSTDEPILETKAVCVGDDAIMICERKGSGSLFWIRLVSGNFPEILGKTYSLKTAVHHITVSEEPEKFVLHIERVKLNDTAVYYCMKTYRGNITFLKGTDLRVIEPEITAVPPVHPGDSVTLHCLVLSDPQKKTCPQNNSVHWVKARIDESHPSLFCAHGETRAECERAHSVQKCVYNCSKNISSDAGTYFCSVATCAEVLFGNETKLDTEAVNTWDSQRVSTVFVALAFSLIVIALLIWSTKACGCCDGTSTAGGQKNLHLRSSRRDEDAWVYSTVIFTMMKSGRGEMSGAKAAERERIYDASKDFGLD